jgi:hypothetical protein
MSFHKNYTPSGAEERKKNREKILRDEVRRILDLGISKKNTKEMLALVPATLNVRTEFDHHKITEHDVSSTKRALNREKILRDAVIRAMDSNISENYTERELDIIPIILNHKKEFQNHPITKTDVLLARQEITNERAKLNKKLYGSFKLQQQQAKKHGQEMKGIRQSSPLPQPTYVLQPPSSGSKYSGSYTNSNSSYQPNSQSSANKPIGTAPKSGNNSNSANLRNSSANRNPQPSIVLQPPVNPILERERRPYQGLNLSTSGSATQSGACGATGVSQTNNNSNSIAEIPSQPYSQTYGSSAQKDESKYLLTEAVYNYRIKRNANSTTQLTNEGVQIITQLLNATPNFRHSDKDPLETIIRREYYHLNLVHTRLSLLTRSYITETRQPGTQLDQRENIIYNTIYKAMLENDFVSSKQFGKSDALPIVTLLNKDFFRHDHEKVSEDEAIGVVQKAEQQIANSKSNNNSNSVADRQPQPYSSVSGSSVKSDFGNAELAQLTEERKFLLTNAVHKERINTSFPEYDISHQKAFTIASGLNRLPQFLSNQLSADNVIKECQRLREQEKILVSLNDNKEALKIAQAGIQLSTRQNIIYNTICKFGMDTSAKFKKHEALPIVTWLNNRGLSSLNAIYNKVDLDEVLSIIQGAEKQIAHAKNAQYQQGHEMAKEQLDKRQFLITEAVHSHRTRNLFPAGDLNQTAVKNIALRLNEMPESKSYPISTDIVIRENDALRKQEAALANLDKVHLENFKQPGTQLSRNENIIYNAMCQFNMDKSAQFEKHKALPIVTWLNNGFFVYNHSKPDINEALRVIQKAEQQIANSKQNNNSVPNNNSQSHNPQVNSNSYVQANQPAHPQGNNLLNDYGNYDYEDGDDELNRVLAESLHSYEAEQLLINSSNANPQPNNNNGQNNNNSQNHNGLVNSNSFAAPYHVDLSQYKNDPYSNNNPIPNNNNSNLPSSSVSNNLPPVPNSAQAVNNNNQPQNSNAPQLVRRNSVKDIIAKKEEEEKKVVYDTYEDFLNGNKKGHYVDCTSLSAIVDPVILQNGSMHEREEITEWFKNHNTDPLTNLILTSKTLTECPAFIKDDMKLMQQQYDALKADELKAKQQGQSRK